MRIFKYPLQVIDTQLIEMPKGAKLLAIKVQRDIVCLWVLCNESAELVTRRIGIYGTGHHIQDDFIKHIATFQLDNGSLVFHAFEILTPAEYLLEVWK
jgi:hypothetical protein